MPDVSNEDLMKLIRRVIKKVDILEAKLDRVLEERVVKPAIPKNFNIEFGFSFTPISNDKELQTVTRKIQEEPDYKENLRHFMEKEEDFTLEDIFKDDYLKHFSYFGVKGMKKLKGLVVFEQIYVYLKSLHGLPLRDIRVKAMQEIRKCKRRFLARNRIEKPDQGSASMESSSNPEHFIDMENFVKMENEQEPPCKIQKVEENVLMDSDEDDLEEETMNETEPEEVLIEVYETYEDKDDAESYDDELNFRPIKNDDELEKVTQKIQNNPEYLKDLRIKIVDESEDGQCTLKQIFTPTYLDGCNVYGKCQKKKLIDMVPYKEVYFYLKSHFGLSLKQIEKDAMKEMKKVKRQVGRLQEASKPLTTSQWK